MRNIIGYCLILSCAILGLGLKFSAATPLPINTTTCEATKVTANSATLNGRISNYSGELVSVTSWFKYGTDRDNYSSISTSTIQSVSGGSTTIIVSTEISGLSPNTTYYYRIVGQSNEYGESTGREQSFTTLSETSIVTGTPTPFSTSDCSNCTIQGRVINAITKKGIKNVWISGTGSYTAITDEDGNYSWYDDDEYRLPELCCGGAYTLTAEADGYESLTQLIDIDPCISNTLDFELQPISTSITPFPSVTPTPISITSISECEFRSIEVLPKKLKLEKGQSSEVTVTLEGDNCVPEGEIIKVKTGKFGSRRISVLPESQATDENGQAKFMITARNRIGSTRVTFKVDNFKKSIIVKVRK